MPPESWHIEALHGVTGVSADHPLSGRARTVSGSPTVSDAVSRLIAPIDASIEADADADTDTDTSRMPKADQMHPQTEMRAPVETPPPTPDAPGAPPAEPQLQRHASSFFQANRFLLPHLVSAVARQVGDGPVVDLYAGVGLFAVTLAACGHEGIVAIEGDPSSAHDLRINAQPFGARVRVEHTSVEEYLAGAPARAHAAAAGATLIVDPPRTGMSREALAAIIGLRAARVLYVSCDVATLARDLRRLLDHGYVLAHLEAFDLFPNTAHIESLAVLSLTD
jgi:tRNA/tmRNA/rRNA uracil-C5-methylase (TrmA/RlmC/RlmD family)